VGSKKGLFPALGLFAAFSFVLAARYREVKAERESFAVRAAPIAAAPRPPLGSAAALLRAEKAVWMPRVSISGTLLPVRETALGFQVPGRVAAVRVKLGDRVKAGQKLAELDPAEARAAHAAALAQVYAAEVRVEIAREDERSSRTLEERGAIPTVQHTKDRRRLDSARAELASVRAHAETLEIALENTQLYAPFSGRVTLARARPARS
jgi:RND family efflux transporter MFP subunit